MGLLRTAVLALVASAVLGWAFCDAALAGNVERCLAVAAKLDLGAPLPRLREKIRAGQTITVVALGSSSTSGFGTLGPGYPEIMGTELKRLHPGLRVTVHNRGIPLDTLPGNLARLKSDVLDKRPDLVVWQVGTNDVVWRGISKGAKRSLRRGVQRIKRAQADVILMDLQDAPVVRSKPSHKAMEALIAAVAREEKVGLFPRFALMQRAQAQGVGGLVGLDGLHNSGDGYACVGRALARMIERSVAR